MKIGQTYFSGYLYLSKQLTTTPLGAGNPAALSVTFHPSTKSLSSSASFKNLRVGTNSFSIFMKFHLDLKGEVFELKNLLHNQTTPQKWGAVARLKRKNPA